MGEGSGGRMREIAAQMRRRGYLLQRRLGAGAFSEVYRVEDRDGRLRACKISGQVLLLEREAQAMQALSHPLFTEFCEFWSQAGLGYLVMEYVAGECLASMLRRRGGFCDAQVMRIGMELAEGLLQLHEGREHCLFRDVKPANIVLRQDGKVKLLDLGCVCPRGERRGVRAGTPGYGAPEQLEGEGVLTEACDVYGLGRTLQELLRKDGPGKAGRRGGLGVKGPGPYAEKPRGGGPGRRRKLERFLEACTRRRPDERIADMRTVMAALLELDEGRFWRGEALCRKNIWESMYKLS